MTAREIEIAVARHFDCRRNLIVPNVSWGLGLHECDLLMLSEAGYATEIEIKISKADLLKDKEKIHGHRSYKVKAFWFAVPQELEEFALANIPEEAGLLSVVEEKRPNRNPYLRCRVMRAATLRSASRKFTAEERYQLARLGLLRYWTLRIPAAATEPTP